MMTNLSNNLRIQSMKTDLSNNLRIQSMMTNLSDIGVQTASVTLFLYFVIGFTEEDFVHSNKSLFLCVESFTCSANLLKLLDVIIKTNLIVSD